MKCNARFCDVCLMDSIKKNAWRANVEAGLEIVAAALAITFFMSLFV